MDSVSDDEICTIPNSATSIANANVPPNATSNNVCKRSPYDSNRNPFLDAAKSTPEIREMQDSAVVAVVKRGGV